MKTKLKIQIGEERPELITCNSSTEITIREDEVFISTAGYAGNLFEKTANDTVKFSLVVED